ncbi:unnamed protein product [Effrenium voratum]|nr:unnamed protein product [Effrenium voratum]
MARWRLALVAFVSWPWLFSLPRIETPKPANRNPDPAAKAQVVICGLGPGSAQHLTRAVWAEIQSAPEVFARIPHPALSGISKVTTFESFYEAESYEDVYGSISERVLRLTEERDRVVYLVPGDPWVAETTTKLILEKAADRNISVEVLPGVSFVEPTLAALQLDLLPRLTVGDAYELINFEHLPLESNTPLLISQVEDRHEASALKVVLLSVFGPQHQVAFVHEAGSSNSKVEWLPLQRLDLSESIGIMTALYVPAASGSFSQLRDEIARRREDLKEVWDEVSHAQLVGSLASASRALEKAAEDDPPEAEELLESLAGLLAHTAAHMQLAEDDNDLQPGQVLSRAVDIARLEADTGAMRQILVVQEPPDVKTLSLEGFDLILTWQDEHLARAEWPQFLPKKLGIGFLRGSKRRTRGHVLRHKIWEERARLSQSEAPADFLEGGGVSRDQRNLQFFNQFVLVIENSKHVNYFSEKLLDVLLARCIPVYWGCPNIADFFDVAGMILIESPDVDEAAEQVISQCHLLPGRSELSEGAVEENCLRAARYAGDFGLRLQKAIEAALEARPELTSQGETKFASAPERVIICRTQLGGPTAPKSKWPFKL